MGSYEKSFDREIFEVVANAESDFESDPDFSDQEYDSDSASETSVSLPKVRSAALSFPYHRY